MVALSYVMADQFHKTKCMFGGYETFKQRLKGVDLDV
jgi:hypothetical protein